MSQPEQPVDQSFQPRWTRLAALGLLLAAAGPLLLLIAGLLWGLDVGDDAPFFAVTIAVGVIGVVLVWRYGTWAKAAGIVAALLLALALFWTAFGLSAPQSFFDFVPAVLVVPGTILAIASCIGAIVAGRRGHLSRRPEGGERWGIRVAVGLLAVLVILSGILTIASRSTVSQGSTATAAPPSRMKDFKFQPTSYSVTGGSAVLVKNDDPFRHSFTVDALGINVDFTPGTSRLIQISARPGTYILYCKYHTSNPDHPTKDDMAATLVVT